MSRFALVRHSSYAVGGNADFEDAVEVFELSTHDDYRVRAAGGTVFATREAAEAAAAAANYPDGRTGAVANAPGYFSSLRLGGAEIYVPRATANVEPAGAVPASRKT